MSEQYTTPVGNSVSTFEDFHDKAKGQKATTLEVTLRTASRTVRKIAPYPELNDEGNLPADYVEGAKDAELMVARYLLQTEGGTLSSQSSVIGTSTSYQSNPKIIEIVTDSLFDYIPVEKEESTGDSGKAYFGRLRR